MKISLKNAKVYGGPRYKNGYRPERGGHAPNILREALRAFWVEKDTTLLDELPKKVSCPSDIDLHEWVHRQLWNCTDIMPDDLCEAMRKKVGSTYAQGVRVWKFGDAAIDGMIDWLESITPDAS